MNTSVVTRAIAFTPLALALWWFLLKGFSLWLLRVLAYLPLGLLIAPAGIEPVKTKPATGEWIFSVALNTEAQNQQTGQMQRIGAVEFAVDDDSLAIFASGWFTYAALALSVAGFSTRRAKEVLKGFGLQTCVNILALGLYVYINAYGAVINAPSQARTSIWLLRYVYHIIYLVVPFASPFAIALLVHPEWRKQFAPPMEKYRHPAMHTNSQARARF